MEVCVESCVCNGIWDCKRVWQKLERDKRQTKSKAKCRVRDGGLAQV